MIHAFVKKYRTRMRTCMNNKIGEVIYNNIKTMFPNCSSHIQLPASFEIIHHKCVNIFYKQYKHNITRVWLGGERYRPSASLFHLDDLMV
jgi:hypothetical protein